MSLNLCYSPRVGRIKNDIKMNGHKILDLPSPTSDSEPVTKSNADTHYSGGGGQSGPKGDKGDVGPQGPKGDTGSQGPKVLKETQDYKDQKVVKEIQDYKDRKATKEM